MIETEWPLEAWTEHPQRYWFRRCDMCRRRRLFGWLYECYPPIGSKFGWWFACPNCLYGSDAWLEELGRELDRQYGAITPDDALGFIRGEDQHAE